jgi:serine/threonine protein kinase
MIHALVISRIEVLERSSSMLLDLSGQRLDRYHLLRLLGSGSFGQVYLAEDHSQTPPAQVALKLLTSFRLNAQDLQAFLNEARTSLRLRHPHIVPLLDLGLDPQRSLPFLVMAYAPGGSLRLRHPRGSRLPLSIVLTYVAQITSALQYAHDAGIIHRDLKPDNLLLDAHDRLLLSDFGIALLASSFATSLSSTAGIAGTPTYMAPEQFLGHPQRASDQYALAVIIYEWLCGEPPFRGTFVELAGQHLQAAPPPLRPRAPEVDPAVEQVLLRALAKQPDERFPSITAFTAALLRAVGTSFSTTLDAHQQSLALLQQAEQSLVQGNRQQALAIYNEAIRLNPSSAVAYNNRGTLRPHFKQLQEALADFSEAIRLKPDLAAAYFNRGLLSSLLGHYEQAIADFNAALRLKPQWAGAYYYRALLQAQLGQLQQARSDYEQASHLDPEFAEAFYSSFFEQQLRQRAQALPQMLPWQLVGPE